MSIPSRSNLTCFDAVSASVRNRLSICLERSAANLSSLLDKQPILAWVFSTELSDTVKIITYYSLKWLNVTCSLSSPDMKYFHAETHTRYTNMITRQFTVSYSQNENSMRCTAPRQIVGTTVVTITKPESET